MFHSNYMKTSEEPKVGQELYHIRLKKGDIPRFVFLPGDPARVKLMASTWKDAKFLSENREYITYSGSYRGTKLAATSTGIGSGAIAIAVEELLRVGADTFIRTGTTGALLKDLKVGSIIISTGAVRGDGATKAYAIPEYPAIANFEVILAAIEAAEKLQVDYTLGLTYSTDSFYLGQSRPGFRGYTNEYSRRILKELTDVKVVNMEMESSTLFVLSSIYGVRAGSIFAVIANRANGEFEHKKGITNMIKVANETMHILAQWDKLKENDNKRYFYPSLLK